MSDPDLTTTNGTPTIATGADIVSILDGYVCCGEVRVLAHSDDNNYACWFFKFLAKRSGSTVTIVNQSLNLATQKSAGALLWNVSLADSSEDGAINIIVTGGLLQNVAWTCYSAILATLAPAT